MLKTVKNGCGIRVDPPSHLFSQNSHIFPFFLGGSVPNSILLRLLLLLNMAPPVKTLRASVTLILLAARLSGACV